MKEERKEFNSEEKKVYLKMKGEQGNRECVNEM
jgi:hypothetical protein